MLPLPSRIEPLEARIAPAGVAVIDVTTLNGANGFRVDGTGAEHYLGTSVDGIGDINGDGFGDFAVSEFASSSQSDRDGRVFVVFGRSNGFPAVVDPLALTGANGFRISGLIGSRIFVPPAVTFAGDVNDDGFDDVLVSAEGVGSVIFGKAGGFTADISPSALNGANGFSFGAPAGGFLESAAAAGDVNGDGIADLSFAQNNNAFVLFGKRSGFAAFVDLTALNGIDGFRIDFPQESSGAPSRAVGRGGDMNGDGFDDVVVGSFLLNTGDDSTAYVLFGHSGPFPLAIDASAVNGSNGFRLKGNSGAGAGFNVSANGDINSDGFDDLVTSTAVVFGHAGVFGATIRTAEFTGANGFALVPSGAPDRTAASAGDFNADGFDDILISEVGTDAAYLIYGKATPFAAAVSIADTDGSNGVTIRLPAGSTADPTPRRTVGSAGDITGDGITELIVGARSADINGTNSGAAHVVFGLAPSLSVGDASVAEGVNGTVAATFTVSLSGTLDRAVSVFVSSADGTAVVNEDYDALAATELTFAPGELTKTVEVAVRGDSKFEPNEIFILNLSNATGATISDAQGVGTITNDDARPSFTINDLSLPEPAEGSTLASLAINLSNPSSETISVTVSTTDGTAVAPGDYQALASTVLTFAPGEFAKVVNVPVHADALSEADETFSVVLSDATNATIGKDTGQVTILNLQPPPTISVADVEVVEGDLFNVAMFFTVTLSSPSSSPVSMTYMLQAGSAHAPADYVALEPTVLTFAPGETTKGVRVETVGNTRDDEDTRTFFFQLSEPSGATFGDPTANGVIVDNDASPSFSITSTTAPEGNNAETFATFTVSLSAASGRATSVEYATASGTATAGQDFTAIPSTLLDFAAGETSKTLTVAISGDTLNEADETFFVNLSAPVNASLAKAQTGTGTILDNDSLPTLSIGDVRIAEGPTGSAVHAVFTISLSAPSGREITATLETEDGSAIADSDYYPVRPVTIRIPAGATQSTVAIDAIGDRELEGNEQFFVTLSSPSGAVVGDGIGTGTIVNDDVLLVSPHVATFTDEDGDLVTVRLTHGKLTADDFTLALGSGTVGLRFAELSLIGRSGGDLVIKAAPQPGLGGNGEVNVGRIDASGTPLARVKVRGDLGEIDAGRGSGASVVIQTTLDLPAFPPAVGILDVRSMGAQRPSGSPYSLESTLGGGADTVLVRGDLTGVRLVARGADAAFGSISIGGDADGDGAFGAGLFSQGRIGAVVVGGNWRASDIAASAAPGADNFFGTPDDIVLPNSGSTVIGAIARIKIVGSVFGTESGADHFGFVAEQLGKVKVAGAVLPLSAGPRNDRTGIMVGSGTDFRAREVG